MNSKLKTHETLTTPSSENFTPIHQKGHKPARKPKNPSSKPKKATSSNQSSLKTSNKQTLPPSPANSYLPFIVIKQGADLLGKRALADAANVSSSVAGGSGEKLSNLETRQKLIKGQTGILNLNNVSPGYSSSHSDANTSQRTSLAPRAKEGQVYRIVENIDVESNHSTNDDPIEGSIAETPSNLSQPKISQCMAEFNRKWNSKEEVNRRKTFYDSFKPIPDKDKLSPLSDLDFLHTTQPTGNTKLGEDFIYDLEIITNKNEKEKIKVSFQPGKASSTIEKVPNKMDIEAREEFFSALNFTTDYRSGYAPIDVQEKQAKQEKEFSYKDHFIKKKQACSSTKLKRTCGVSYVKRQESEQLHVNHIFEKLLPLVFQGSTECVRLEDYEICIEQVFENVFKEQQNKHLLVTTLEADNEAQIREYLYFPERRLKIVKGNFYLVKSLDAIWQFFREKLFVCIHLVYDEKELIKPLDLNGLSKDEVAIALAQSNIQLGILCKRSTSGKKAFLKAFLEGKEVVGDGELDSDEEDGKAKAVEKKSETAVKRKESATTSNLSKVAAKKESKTQSKENKKKKKEEKKAEDDIEAARELAEQLDEEEEDEPRLLEGQIKNFEKIKRRALNSSFYNGMPLNRNTRDLDETYSQFMSLAEIYKQGVFQETRKSSNSEVIPEELEEGKTMYHGEILNGGKGDCSIFIEAYNESSRKSSRRRSSDGSDLYHLKQQEELINEIVAEEMKQEVLVEKDDGLDKEKDMERIIENVNAQEQKPKSTKKKAQKEKKKEEVKQSKALKVETGPQEEEKLNNDPDDILKNRQIVELIEEIKADTGKSLSTMSTRVELYTQEESWKTASKHTKNLLYTFITHMVDILQEKFRVWTKLRLDVGKEGDTGLLFESKKNIFLANCGFNYDENTLRCLVPLQINLNWGFNPAIKAVGSLNSTGSMSRINTSNLKTVNLADLQHFSDHPDTRELLSMNLPLYQITTRDSFAYDLIEKVSLIDFNGRKTKKIEYFFDPSSYPANFKSFVDKFPDYRVGVTTYADFYTNEELCQIEGKCYETERNFFSNQFLPMTGQMTCMSEKVRRTKFFFGARYIWTKQQLSESHSNVGAGIRVDVTAPPKWMKDLVEAPMVEAGIMEKDFVNAIAMNVYHDGKEGIAQHFDDAVRFKQPIFSLRIFSDSRLSFGSQLYGFCNGAFCIPMPRGCITILEEDSYAANGIKHCVRPCDMTGKSAALILRQMHHRVFNEAKLYDEYVDFPTWFSTLSIKDDAVCYGDQKRIEADANLKPVKKEIK